MKYRALIISRAFSRFPERGVARLKSAGIDTIVSPPEGTPDRDKKILDMLPGTHVIFSGGGYCSKPIIHASKVLRVIAICGAGYDSADLESATDAGVVVVNSPAPGLMDAVADLTFGLVLALARQIPQQNATVKGKGFRVESGVVGVQVNGKTLGIVGLGRIGKAVARRGYGFSMKILAYDKVCDKDFAAKFGVEYVDLENLLKKSDFVSINMNLSEETRGIIGQKELRYMKPDSFLVNTARGELVDEEALYNALQNRQIAGAGLDDISGNCAIKDKLVSLDNVLCTPHIGNLTYEGIHEVIDLAVSQAIDVLEGRKPKFVLNPEVYKRIDIKGAMK